MLARDTALGHCPLIAKVTSVKKPSSTAAIYARISSDLTG
jgi:hypothetical protein